MKKLIILMLIISICALAQIGFAQVIPINGYWTQPMTNADGSPLTDLAGWNLYETTGGGRVKVNTNLIPVSSCTGTNPLTCQWTLPTGTAVKGDKFVIVAVDAMGSVSADSNEAIYGVKPTTPTIFTIR